MWDHHTAWLQCHIDVYKVALGLCTAVKMYGCQCDNKNMSMFTPHQCNGSVFSVPQVEYPLHYGAVEKKVIMYTSCCTFSG